MSTLTALGAPPETGPAEKASAAAGDDDDGKNSNVDDDIYQHSNYVYILDPEHSWVPAQVTDRSAVAVIHLSVPRYRTEQDVRCDGGRTARSFEKVRVDLADPRNSAPYPNRHLPLQNVNNEGELQVVEDMVDLPFLHEVRAVRSCARSWLCVPLWACVLD